MAIPANALYTFAQPITPSDTINIVDAATVTVPPVCDAIWVGGAGIVVAILQNGTAVQFTCVAGSLLPVRAKRVNNTNTTATLMVALYQ